MDHGIMALKQIAIDATGNWIPPGFAARPGRNPANQVCHIVAARSQSERQRTAHKTGSSADRDPYRHPVLRFQVHNCGSGVEPKCDFGVKDNRIYSSF
jgi:hypothetical protein